MSREEDLIRSTTAAIASTVREVPPLRLEPAADELRPATGGRRLAGGGRSDRGGGRRRWQAWLAPVTAAAVVVALAVSLVIVKGVQNGSPVPKSPTTSTAGPGGAPRYYAALKVITGSSAMQAAGGNQEAVVVGDSVTGKTLATLTPPANTTFQSVSAAADDRTFVVFAVTSSTGSFLPFKGVTLTGSWYKVRLDPGAASPARLSRLPIKSWSWAADDFGAPSPGQIYATALSESGQEIAVADIPVVRAADKPQNWQEVKVFSVTTGRLLHDWTENDPNASLATVLSSSLAGVPAGTPALTWIDGDRALALATSHEVSNTVTGTVRRLNVTGPGDGNLLADSTVIWSGTLSWDETGECYSANGWPPQISADGRAISCVTFTMPYATDGHLYFGTAPLTAGTPANVKPTVDYRATMPPEKKTGGIDVGIVWISPSAGTLIVQWIPGGTLSPGHHMYFGVVSHGKFIPLRVPASLATSASVAF